MQDVIQLLPESLANQIAAGEVVQRPASVVKELLENAVDAGSTNVQLVIKKSGKLLIQVIDNGCGMSETDARMSLERHATSKITKSDDLFCIRTFGFRGEALASIAAVAQMEVTTRRKIDEVGTLLRVEGSELKEQESVSCQEGTTISVKNLFYNVPARRKFLKSDPVEMRHIIDEFQRVAIAHPEIAFSLYQDDLEVFNLKQGKLAKRLVGVFGKNYQDRLVSCQEEVQHIKIWGYVGKPESAKKTRGEQFFFVNERFIKHPYLNHAVTKAFEGLIGEDYYPFYAIFIELDPKHVDVNVHPTKTEVKFDDERTLYAVIQSAVRQALASFGVAPSLDFGFNVNFSDEDARKSIPSFSSENPGYLFHSDERPPKESLQQRNLENWQQLYPNQPPTVQQKIASGEQENVEVTTFSSAANELESGGQETKVYTPKEKQTIQVQNKYLFCQTKSGVMVIDQKAAYERILFDQFMARRESETVASQKLLFPVTLTLTIPDYTLLSEFFEEISKLGFTLEDFGKNTVVVSGVPTELDEAAPEENLQSILQQLKEGPSVSDVGITKKVVRVMAKRAATLKQKPLEELEINALIEQLFTSSNPNYTPDGKKIVSMLYVEDIENLFG